MPYKTMGYLSHLLTHLLTSRTAPEALDNRRQIFTEYSPGIAQAFMGYSQGGNETGLLPPN